MTSIRKLSLMSLILPMCCLNHVSAEEPAIFRGAVSRYATGSDDTRSRSAWIRGLHLLTTFKEASDADSHVPELPAHCFERSVALTGSLFSSSEAFVAPSAASGPHGSAVWCQAERFQDQLATTFSRLCNDPQISIEQDIKTLLELASNWKKACRDAKVDESLFFNRLESFLRFRLDNDQRRAELAQSGFFCHEKPVWTGGPLLEFGMYLERYRLVPKYEAVRYAVTLCERMVVTFERQLVKDREASLLSQQQTAALAAQKIAVRQRVSAYHAARAAASPRMSPAQKASLARRNFAGFLRTMQPRVYTVQIPVSPTAGYGAGHGPSARSASRQVIQRQTTTTRRPRSGGGGGRGYSYTIVR